MHSEVFCHAVKGPEPKASSITIAGQADQGKRVPFTANICVYELLLARPNRAVHELNICPANVQPCKLWRAAKGLKTALPLSTAEHC